LPDSMSMAAAAGFLVNYGTTYHALVQRANLKAGEALLVLGAAGGVGTATIAACLAGRDRRVGPELAIAVTVMSLFALGVVLGTLIGFGILLGVSVPGVPWLVAVALTKLALLGSLGLIATGGVMHRLARRQEERDRLPASPSGEPL